LIRAALPLRIGPGQSRPGGRRRIQTAREESPGSTGQGAGQRPAEATRGKAPQKTNRRRKPARVKRCGKSAPRPWRHGRHGKPHPEQGHIGEQCGCPPRSRVARWRPAATPAVEECPLPPGRQRPGETEPGLQDGSDLFPLTFALLLTTRGHFGANCTPLLRAPSPVRPRQAVLTARTRARARTTLVIA